MQVNRSYTSAAASAAGFGNDVTGATFALTATSAGDSLAHKVTILNNTATDHSAKTVVLVGTDANGSVQTETLAAPGTSTSVTSTKYFLTLTSATPSATIGVDTFDIGWAAASITPFIYVKPNPTNSASAIGFSCDITGSPTYSMQHSYGGNWYSHSVVAAKSADADGSYLFPVVALRLAFTAAGGVALNLIQSGQ